ncbi:SDR family oxidoreductase [Pelagibacteraceae bacterium]|jgi:enoyl-[acyl-carrier protein] reductase I|nr:SDR family oxidoreductase [Pelagibacteraceae bacterium]MDA9652057.1 SDR family oxidoreductase [Pelagibacteraceae bacterium]MDC1366176.1 SDR family oxidoreductase [Pelagibacterales bacterium]|tara:strand:+ start:786 stop:1562 length:777 start_codon:yes stop_codon:yes gene_type:complete
MYLKGKKGVIMGLANDHSIAWGVAKKLSEEGAELCFMYAGETLLRRVQPLAESLNSNFLIECNVLDTDSIQKAFNQVKDKWGSIDFVLHSIAFSDKNELKGKYLDTSRDNFTQTMLISCFSFTETAKEASKLMVNGGALVTLSYDGSQRVVPNYNVMGVAKAALESSVRYLATDLGGQNIRVNSLSAGPMKTLAMAGISGGKDMLKWSDKNSLMQRNITLEDVGKSGFYLLSDLSSGVTGENHYVDCGYNKVGVPREI